MNRTPRSASLRASRQLPQTCPALRASSPYSSNVLSGSSDRSVNSGTEACIRNAISYCAMRVAISGSPVCSKLRLVQIVAGQSRKRRRAVACRSPAGSTDTEPDRCPTAKLHALIPRRQKSAAPQPVGQRLIAKLARPAKSSQQTRAGPCSRCPARTRATIRCSAARRVGSRSGRT